VHLNEVPRARTSQRSLKSLEPLWRSLARPLFMAIPDARFLTKGPGRAPSKLLARRVPRKGPQYGPFAACGHLRPLLRSEGGPGFPARLSGLLQGRGKGGLSKDASGMPLARSLARNQSAGTFSCPCLGLFHGGLARPLAKSRIKAPRKGLCNVPCGAPRRVPSQGPYRGLL
jgi:hypothetical protein